MAISAPRFAEETRGRRTLRAALSHTLAALQRVRYKACDDRAAPLKAHVARLVFVAAALVENRDSQLEWIDASRWRRRLDSVQCTDEDDLANVLLAVQAREACASLLGAGTGGRGDGREHWRALEYAPGGLAAGVAPRYRDDASRRDARARRLNSQVSMF